MRVFDNLANQAGRLANDVQTSLRRARVEGERRLLARQHRAALEDLGERAYEVVRSGQMEEGPLGPEIAAVESKLMEIEAKVTEIDSLREHGEAEEAPAAPEDGTPSAGATEGRPARDPTATAFPMADEPPSPGAGWDAAERFFRPRS